MMKNTLIRAFVLMIAVAGFGASTVASANSVKATITAKDVVPFPTCAPNNPSYCGMQ